MPRRSAADLEIPAPLQSAPRRLPPPPHLSRAQRDVWIATTAALPGDWFKQDQAPILERYCACTVHARDLEKLLASTDAKRAPGDHHNLVRSLARETRMLLSL